MIKRVLSKGISENEPTGKKIDRTKFENFRCYIAWDIVECNLFQDVREKWLTIVYQKNAKYNSIV